MYILCSAQFANFIEDINLVLCCISFFFQVNATEDRRSSSSSSDSDLSSIAVDNNVPLLSDDDDDDARMPPCYEENNEVIVPDDYENELEDGDDDFPTFPQDDKLVFKGIYFQEVWAMITSFKIMHRTSDVAVLNLCKMINALLSPASPKRLPETVKQLKKKMFSDCCLTPRTWIVFCTLCKRELMKSNAKPAAAACTNCR